LKLISLGGLTNIEAKGKREFGQAALIEKGITTNKGVLRLRQRPPWRALPSLRMTLKKMVAMIEAVCDVTAARPFLF